MKSSPRLVLPLIVMLLSLAAAVLTAKHLSPDAGPAVAQESMADGSR